MVDPEGINWLTLKEEDIETVKGIVVAEFNKNIRDPVIASFKVSFEYGLETLSPTLWRILQLTRAGLGGSYRMGQEARRLLDHTFETIRDPNRLRDEVNRVNNEVQERINDPRRLLDDIRQGGNAVDRTLRDFFNGF